MKMNSLWNNLYEASRDRRYGILFLTTFLACFVVFALGVWIYRMISEFEFATSDFQAVLALLVLPGMIVSIGALTWRAVRKTKPLPNERFRRKEMSRDEIIKARSKLVKLKN